MVMTAFPPIEALDDKAGSGWDNIRDFEQQQLKAGEDPSYFFIE